MTSYIELLPILQTAIGPVILISGIGLLLLTMTNRLGRTIDRARDLVATPAGGQRVEDQLAVLWLRARLLRLSILLAAMSALCVALLVIILFLSVLMKIDSAWLISGLFMGSMLLLIGSLVVLIHDINQSLAALKLELSLQKPNAA
jgi:hypothetical protein